METKIKNKIKYEGFWEDQEFEDFVNDVGDFMGSLQPDGTFKYSKLGWLG